MDNTCYPSKEAQETLQTYYDKYNELKERGLPEPEVIAEMWKWIDSVSQNKERLRELSKLLPSPGTE